MKLYKFYNNVSYEGDDGPDRVEEKHPLIGFTVDKEIRDMYVKSRKPDSYIEVVSKVDKDEFVEYANSYNGQMLDIHEYSDPSYTKTREVDLKQIPIVTSWFEKETISHLEDEGVSYIMDNSIRCNVIFPFVFKGKYVEALEKLEFISFWKLLGGPQAYERVMTDDELESCDDYSAPSIIWHEFNSLIDEYSQYF